MGNRERATSELLKYVRKITGDNKNVDIYKSLLGKMSDKQFDLYMTKLRSGEESLFFMIPNLTKSKISASNNIKVAEELGHNFYEHLELTDPDTGLLYRTPIPYLVIDLPCRRQAQTLEKKVAIPKDVSRIDELTGQVSGDSTASMSRPELQNLLAQGLESGIEELIKFRGGDEEAMRNLNNEIIQTGSGSLTASAGSGRVRSTETISAYLKGMHLDNNL